MGGKSNCYAKSCRNPSDEALALDRNGTLDKMRFAALGLMHWEYHAGGCLSQRGPTSDGSPPGNCFSSSLSLGSPKSPRWVRAGQPPRCCTCGMLPGTDLPRVPAAGTGATVPPPTCSGAFPSSSASRQEEGAPVWLFPLQVALPTNYSTCKSMSRAYSLAINQYKLKGHLVCFCNNAL